ncbi:MAG: hypothetical protein GAK41_01348 [Burkholderia gladioli]|nr:MAG: hypothetical protein GAK41_01348 [Burkholderia gladioli]
MIATQPLTHDEVWTTFEPGELRMFQCGDVAAQTRVKVPEIVLEKLRNPSLDPSSSLNCPRGGATVAATAAGDTTLAAAAAMASGDDPVDF